MSIRKMKLMIKRTALGNIFAVVTCGSLILLYFCLLRYNTHNTYFDIRPHEIRKRYIRGEPLQIKVPWKKLLHSNIYRGKGGNWTRRPGPNSPLSLFVVEEHHEVIPYWFDAANARAISRHGNTLVHIDGHADMALPAYFSDYPLFRWPKTKQDFKLLMQRNDVFIMEAIIAGLIKRVIWIWPVWDQKSHTNLSYELFKTQVGTATLKDKEGQPYQVFCLCELLPKPSKTCEYSDYESENLNSKEIPRSQCNAKKTFLYEVIREDVALDYLHNSKWLPIKDEVILDIDEDYYGCVYASQPLLDSGIKNQELEHISNYLSKLVCPKSLAQERYADSVLVLALDLYKNMYSCKMHNTPETAKKKCPSQSKTNSDVNAFLLKKFWGNKKIHLCSKQLHAVKYAINEINHSFQKLNSKQVKIMQRVGFCLSTSPKTFKLTNPSVFGLCIGNNKPSESNVVVYSPSKKDISEKTKVLQNIFYSMKSKSVKLVTIARSLRDGYTPRRYGKQIEDNIISSLNKTFDNSCVVHYDNGLLGGIKGWLSRPTPKHL